MSVVGSCEAKTHLSALLERVRKGEHITITKRASLSPCWCQLHPIRSKSAGK
jgi:antitoxin (DNA-binding transcriptional repressor) of toxin-antitoxin stability system